MAESTLGNESGRELLLAPVLANLDRAHFFAARVLGTPQAAEDAVQEACLRYLRRSPENRGEPALAAYFMRLVCTAALDIQKAEAARRRREEVAGMIAGKPKATPEARSATAEAARAARRELDTLPQEIRMAVCLCCEAGYSEREAAEIMGVPLSTVSHRVRRGLDELRSRLTAAGYAALAPAALGQMLGGLGLPSAPAALVGKIKAMSVMYKAAGSSAAAVKGGVAMKIVAGVVAAGVLAGTIGLMGPIGPMNSPPAAAAPAERKDPPENQKYSMRILVWNFWSSGGGILDGAAGQAESADLIKGHDVDNAGNVYWTECDAPVIRRYSPKTDRVETVAGSIRGFADGPLSRARFGGWSYNSTNLICVSGDGKHLFVRDCFGKGQWRYVDLEAGTVTSLGQWHHFKGGYFIIAKDKCGEIYAFVTSGQDPPDCKGYKKLKVAASKAFASAWYAWDRYALDVEKMKFYFHMRGPVSVCDLKTGEIACLTSADNKARPINTSGPLETTCFLCPTGMAISPAGRYVYVGQGDGSSCFRLDLEKKQALIWGSLDGGGFGWREGNDRDKNSSMTGCTGWPAATNFIPDGRGFWANCWGLYALTPMKGGN